MQVESQGKRHKQEISFLRTSIKEERKSRIDLEESLDRSMPTVPDHESASSARGAPRRGSGTSGLSIGRGK